MRRVIRPKVQVFQEGDIVGIPLTRVNKSGEITGLEIACRGQIKRIYQPRLRAYWRAEVYWDTPGTAFVYTGKDGWAYLHELVLISRVDPKARRA